jgi:5-carboxymethyl-2-hydroxymuconic-semialdehyde dehydrogenase
VKVGSGIEPDSEMGPLITREHRDKVASYVDGSVVFRGDVPGGRGFWFPPTLLAPVSNDSRQAQEEIFGPVACVIPFDDEDDAVRLANETPFGLSGSIWTRDVGRAHRMAQALEAGMIWVNSENVRHLPTPFGGMKASGIGRDGGDYSFDFYMETKNIAIALGDHKIPRIGG